MEKKKETKKKKAVRNRIFAGAVLFTMLVPSAITVYSTVQSAVKPEEPESVEELKSVGESKKSVMELDNEGE